MKTLFLLCVLVVIFLAVTEGQNDKHGKGKHHYKKVCKDINTFYA